MQSGEIASMSTDHDVGDEAVNKKLREWLEWDTVRLMTSL
jgi:hypothetical protein